MTTRLFSYIAIGLSLQNMPIYEALARPSPPKASTLTSR